MPVMKHSHKIKIHYLKVQLSLNLNSIWFTSEDFLEVQLTSLNLQPILPANFWSYSWVGPHNALFSWSVWELSWVTKVVTKHGSMEILEGGFTSAQSFCHQSQNFISFSNKTAHFMTFSIWCPSFGACNSNDKVILKLNFLSNKNTGCNLQMPQRNSESFEADIDYFGGGFLKKQNLVWVLLCTVIYYATGLTIFSKAVWQERCMRHCVV